MALEEAGLKEADLKEARFSPLRMLEMTMAAKNPTKAQALAGAVTGLLPKAESTISPTKKVFKTWFERNPGWASETKSNWISKMQQRQGSAIPLGER